MSSVAWLLNQLPSQFTGVFHSSVLSALKLSNSLPRHVAVIMDGNRRYARTHNLPIHMGHERGFQSLEKLLEICFKLGISAVTAYAFSIDNFNRSPSEIKALMDLAKDRFEFFCTKSELVQKYQVRIKVIGNLSLLPKDVQAAAEKVMRMTANNNKSFLTLCFPYTSTDELATLVLRHAKEEASDSVITPDIVANNLYTADIPPLDLLIRSSGESRLSDFLLWQEALRQPPQNRGCQLHFVKVNWPEFNQWDLIAIMLAYLANQSYSTQSI